MCFIVIYVENYLLYFLTLRKSVTFLIFSLKNNKQKHNNKKEEEKKKCIKYFLTEYIADMHCLRTNHNH